MNDLNADKIECQDVDSCFESGICDVIKCCGECSLCVIKDINIVANDMLNKAKESLKNGASK